MNELLKEILQQAENKGACYKTSDVKDWKSLVNLFFSPQGCEFCIDNDFPSIDLFDRMKAYVAPYGVYINNHRDASSSTTDGDIFAHNKARIGLIGATKGKLLYDNTECVHKVMLMHGATADIIIKGYAIVRLITDGTCHVNIEKDNTAIVLR